MAVKTESEMSVLWTQYNVDDFVPTYNFKELEPIFIGFGTLILLINECIISHVNLVAGALLRYARMH